MAALARRHRITGVSLIGPSFERDAVERAMSAYCEEVVLVPARRDRGLGKRLLQMRSVLSPHSFERHFATVPALQTALDGLLRRRRYDAISIEFPFLSHYRLRQAPVGAPCPLLVLDEHNIEHDLARQSGDASQGALRRLYHRVNSRRLLREELHSWRHLDGVAFTSADDAARAQALLPSFPAAVIPNAVDIGHFRPRPDLPPPDGRTVVFFGTLNYFPNQDGVRYLLEEIWPLVQRSHPQALLKVIGSHPTPEVLRHQGPAVDIVGLVEDVRPHLAQASAIVVPLRVGGGTRFKVLEALAMGRPVVSTRLGAEGIDVAAERDILLADGPEPFAAAVGRLLDDPALGRRLGAAGRALVEQSYSWETVAGNLEGFFRELLHRRASASASTP